ncbi:uncharacterized protein LOC126188776 [Schistocerca cancellata]|uniref:uncharacterized protein LOC126188776 n=1 Tax=Schistocerca cancellata TaxID=274614 RepID=UPI002119788D|nr:uncharacterized protein LOC126188776 [Schistocerca cancellata]
MDFRAGVVLWLAVLCLQYQICSAEPSSNCSAYRAANHDEGGGDVRESKIAETSPWCGDEQKSDESGNYQRQVRTVADNRLPGVDGMRSMQRLPWIGGDIQKFAADLHDAKVRADAERQPTEEFHKVAESLMELLVRISENPDHWRVMTKNILQARVAGGDGDGVLPPEDKKSSADNRSDNQPPRPGRTRTPDSRRRRLGFSLNKKKKPRQKGQRQRQGQAEGQEKDADANRTDARAAGRPLTEQEARRQRLRQLAEAGVVVPTVPALPRPGAGGGRAGGGGGRGGGGGKGRRPKVAAPPTTQLPPRENQLLKQDWRNFQQQKMMWKHTRPTFEPENPGQGKFALPVQSFYNAVLCCEGVDTDLRAVPVDDGER